MCLDPEIAFSVPVETAHVARACFSKGNVYMTMRDELGTIFEDPQFADLFPPQGQPAEAPWRLALTTLFQFAENLTDRQAADAVRSRIDWKYAMGLELTDPGFDYSVLSEFRTRLLRGEAQQRLLDLLLSLARQRGWLQAGGKQRTDSTHVVAAIQGLNRLQIVAETLRQALDTLAQEAPEWLLAQMRPEWADRYGKRWDTYRLPRQESERAALAAVVGEDGRYLLGRLASPEAPASLLCLPAVQVLRQVWVQQFVMEEGTLRQRDAKELPPALQQILSPYDAQARYSTKREMGWSGYKVHLTESCDEEAPHLITHVQTTPAPLHDGEVTATIQAELAAADLSPSEHLVDEGYTDAPLLVESQQQGIDLLGPVARDGSWQAAAGQGYDQSHFVVDWDAEKVCCPAGKQSHLWFARRDDQGNDIIQVKFSPKDCGGCGARALCTRSQRGAREISLRPQEQYLALQQRRQYQKTRAFQERYRARAGIEGTLSQGIHIGGMRRSRYIGQAKTHLQNVAIACALNLYRMVAWLMQRPRAKTRTSHFARLCAPPIPAPA